MKGEGEMELTLTKREKELQTDVCELEWPDDPTERFSILKLVHEFMVETETSMRRTAVIIGWPNNTLHDRLKRFRSSTGVKLAAGEQHGKVDTQMEKARRIAKANPEAFIDDAATARKMAGAMTDNDVARKIVGAAFEADPLRPMDERSTSKQRVEDQAPGELLLMEFYGWFIKGKVLLKRAGEAGKLNKRGREDLEETAERARALIDLIVTAATSGDWDEELAELIEEGA